MTLGEFFTLLGFLTGGLVLYVESRRLGLATEGMRIVVVSGLLAGVVGARLAEWLTSGQMLATPLLWLQPQNGGKALLGGIAAGWLAVVLTKRRLGIRRGTGDLWALALPAGEAVGRIGCHFNTCCYGLRCSQQSWLTVWQHGSWRLPSQLLSSAGALLLFLVLWNLRTRLRHEGDLWKLYLIGYGVVRFALEWTRDRPLALGQLSAVQLICLETVICTSIPWWVQLHRDSRTIPRLTSSYFTSVEKLGPPTVSEGK